MLAALLSLHVLCLSFSPFPLPSSLLFLEQVRTKAVDTLVAVYKTVGEKVRTDLSKRGIPQARLAPILAKFDEALANGAVANEVSPGAVLSSYCTFKLFNLAVALCM